MADSISPICTRFHRAVELIGGRWTGAIIRTLLQGRTRYAHLKAAVPDITDRMLSERLRFLETEGVLTRRVLPASPVRVEYELTEKGHSLERALNEIGVWAERWIPGDSEQVEEAQTPTRHEPFSTGVPAGARGPRIKAR